MSDSEQLLKQNIRENIIDYLGTASSVEQQIKYEQGLLSVNALGIVSHDSIDGIA